MSADERTQMEQASGLLVHEDSPLWPLYESLYAWRRPLVLTFYGLLAVAAYLAGFLLRFEFTYFTSWWPAFVLTAPAVAVTRMVLAGAFQLSVGRWRFISTVDVLRLFLATSVGTAALLLLTGLLPEAYAVPRSVLLIEWVITTQLTAGLWLAYRTGFERLRHARWNGDGSGRKRVAIVGAGEAGNMLAREIQRYPTGYELIGFVDDDPMKRGSRIRGIPMLGSTGELSTIVRDRDLDELILAIPSAEPTDLRRLVRQCERADVPFRVLPGIREVLSGNVRLAQLRELRIEDLLGREPVRLELPELAEDVAERCVLITGAAGSIGSELARQLALHKPRRLVLLDQAETDLFYLEMEIRHAHPGLELIPVIGDIVDRRLVDRVFDEHRPDWTFHAAAYKHVPLMERNAEQAVRNNVVGTRLVAEAAGRHGCGKFVLVSTDKAVQPRNVMGATKRLAELVVLGLQRAYPRTAYGAVRFGNVLGSKGSVIPIFQRQIELVQPLTVTHPDATRYFMTIPEAVQLILQASLLDEFRGHIAMLDMGEPVRIVELASNMLRLAGIPAREGENIVFTGLRPGEKMHEELASPDERSMPTRTPKVRILRTGQERGIPVLDIVARWDGQFDEGEGAEAVAELRALFHGLDGANGKPDEEIALSSTFVSGFDA